MNKKIKQSLLMFSGILYFVSNFTTLNAQTDLQDENPAQQINVSNISLGAPLFEDKIYQRGDVVEVTLTVVNGDEFDYTNMSINSSIVVSSEEKGTLQYGYQETVSELFIPKQSTKEITFQYKYPEGVFSSVDDVVRFEVNLKKQSGETFGNSGDFINISHVKSQIELVDAFLKTSEFEYALQEGPVVQINETAQIYTSLKNVSDREINLYPKLKVYDRDITGNEITTKDYDLVTLGVASESSELKFDIPNISKPGVYQGELTFADTFGINQVPALYVRWIVDGDFVAILDVAVNSQTFKKRDVAIIDVIYNGPPQNIDTGETRSIGMGSLRVDLYNQKDILIGTKEQEVDFSIAQGKIQFQIPVTSKANGIKVNVTALKDGNEISSSETIFMNQNTVETENKIMALLSLFGVLIILIFITSYMYGKKINKKMIVGILFAFAFLGSPQVSDAARACYDDGKYFCVTVNTNGTTFTPSANMNYAFVVQAETWAAQTVGGTTYVEWRIRQNGNDVRSGSVTDTYGKGATTNATSVWRTIGAFYPATASGPVAPVIAPPTPGTYNLNVKVWNTSRYKDGGGDGVDRQKGPVNFNFTITVACPSGQNWDGANCVNPPVVPPPVYGSCGSYIWSCNSGGAAYGSENTNSFSWMCLGSNGGSNASCSLPKPPAPTNLASSCTPDGSTVNMSWSMPGYSRVYFRNYDTVAQQYYGNNDDLWSWSAALGGITHNRTYSWWVHTKADNGTYSNPAFAQYACSPKQPSSLSVACSADGRTATFSWVNPSGYNRVYFRNYDNTAKGYYGNNEDVWGTTYSLYNITPGNNYGWWIHTRDAAGNAGPAVSGNFTCTAAPVDQCTNVSGIQSTVPAYSTKNANGTCSCAVGKHFEGAVCVDDIVPVSSLTVSCSAPSAELGQTTTFTASSANASGPVSYQWMDRNQNNIIGETSSTLSEVYTTVNSHTVYIRATDSLTSVTNFCNATVRCDSSHIEGETTLCDLSGNQNRYTCTSTGWQAIPQICGGPGTGSDPVVSGFELDPNIVSVGNNCGLNLTASNVSSCRLTSNNSSIIDIALTGTNSISLTKSRIVPVGRHTLSCTNTEGTITKDFGTKSCVLNPDIREN